MRPNEKFSECCGMGIRCTMTGAVDLNAVSMFQILT
jgi:hypothetical protein